MQGYTSWGSSFRGILYEIDKKKTGKKKGEQAPLVLPLINLSYAKTEHQNAFHSQILNEMLILLFALQG